MAPLNWAARMDHGDVPFSRLISFGPCSARRRLASALLSPGDGAATSGADAAAGAIGAVVRAAGAGVAGGAPAA